MNDRADESESEVAQRPRSADEREHALSVHEARVGARESRQVERMAEVEDVLTRAAQRD